VLVLGRIDPTSRSTKTAPTACLLGLFGETYILVEAGSGIVALLCGMLKRKNAVKSCVWSCDFKYCYSSKVDIPSVARTSKADVVLGTEHSIQTHPTHPLLPYKCKPLEVTAPDFLSKIPLPI
jgi:hypothetical protein